MNTNPLHKKIDIDTLNNEAINTNQRLVDLSEQAYHIQIQSVAQSVANSKTIAMLLIAGPSSSAKTTTARKVCEELLLHGTKSVSISLDDFIIDNDKLPILPSGKKDFETINTIDIPHFQECINKLLDTGECDFPIFDFVSGGYRKKDERRSLKVDDNTVLVVEGLHALNPSLLQNIDPSRLAKLYISPNSDYCMNKKLVLSALEVRLVRRIIRDFNFRNTSVERTIDMWRDVVASENEYIIPFKETANYIIDSTIDYEPCVYKKHLMQIVDNTDLEKSEYADIITSLGSAIQNFEQINRIDIPSDTILYEFILPTSDI